VLLYTLSKTALTCSSVKQAVGVLVDVGLAVVVLRRIVGTSRFGAGGGGFLTLVRGGRGGGGATGMAVLALAVVSSRFGVYSLLVALCMGAVNFPEST
jgi:hypothetical protein